MKWLSNKKIGILEFILVGVGLLTILPLLLLGLTHYILFLEIFRVALVCFVWYALFVVLYREICKILKEKK